MKIKRHNGGQATIEFIFSFGFIMIFLLVFVKMAINFTNGYLVQYATFMAARAYLVADQNNANSRGNEEYARTRALQVYQSFRPDLFLPGGAPIANVNSPENLGLPIYSGVWVEFTQRFSGQNILGGDSEVPFRSEAFLGREPSRSVCLERVCFAINSAVPGACPPGGGSAIYATLVDNGC